MFYLCIFVSSLLYTNINVQLFIQKLNDKFRSNVDRRKKKYLYFIILWGCDKKQNHGEWLKERKCKSACPVCVCLLLLLAYKSKHIFNKFNTCVQFLFLFSLMWVGVCVCVCHFTLYSYLAYLSPFFFFFFFPTFCLLDIHIFISISSLFILLLVFHLNVLIFLMVIIY